MLSTTIGQTVGQKARDVAKINGTNIYEQAGIDELIA
jgi:hypothetical protein